MIKLFRTIVELIQHRKMICVVIKIKYDREPPIIKKGQPQEYVREMQYKMFLKFTEKHESALGYEWKSDFDSASVMKLFYAYFNCRILTKQETDKTIEYEITPFASTAFVDDVTKGGS